MATSNTGETLTECNKPSNELESEVEKNEVKENGKESDENEMSVQTEIASNEDNGKGKNIEIVENEDQVDSSKSLADNVFPTVKSSSEEDAMLSWQKHRKHFLIISQAGKPIYSRHGDEFKLSAFCGTLQAIISFVENQGDQIQSIQAGSYQVVFLSRGLMYFCAISSKGEPVSVLKTQLEFLYSQIIMILTSAVERSLMKNPKCDVKNLLGGTESSFSSLSSSFSSRFDSLLHCFSCLPLPSHFRMIACKSLQKSFSPSLLFSILLCENKLVAMARDKNSSLHSDDLFLLSNFVNSSKTFRTSESFTPLCLPKFDPSKFVFAYIDFIFPNVALILISNDCNSFFQLKNMRSQIASDLTASGTHQEIAKSHLRGDLKIVDLPFSLRRLTSASASFHTEPAPASPSSLPSLASKPKVNASSSQTKTLTDPDADHSDLEEGEGEREGEGEGEGEGEMAMGLLSQGDKVGIDLALEAKGMGMRGLKREDFSFSFSENEWKGLTGGPAGLLHFCFSKPKTLHQYVASDHTSPLHSEASRKSVFQAYQKIHSSMTEGNHKMQFKRDDSYVILGWRTSEFEIYAIFDPLAQKRTAIAVCNSICQWIFGMENELFITNLFT